MKNIDVLQEIDKKMSCLHLFEEDGDYKLCGNTSLRVLKQTVVEVKELLDTTRMERNLEIKENKLCLQRNI